MTDKLQTLLASIRHEVAVLGSATDRGEIDPSDVERLKAACRVIKDPRCSLADAAAVVATIETIAAEVRQTKQ